MIGVVYQFTVGVQFEEANYQEKIMVKELCIETESLYNSVNSYLNRDSCKVSPVGVIFPNL